MLVGLYMPRILLKSEMMADATIPPVLFVANFLTLSPICAWVYGSAKSGFLVSLCRSPPTSLCWSCRRVEFSERHRGRSGGDG